MKLTSLIAGAFGITGFVLSVLSGLIADNSFESILLKALLCAIICYIVGYFVGLIGQQVSSEHAVRLAKEIARKDAAEEQERLEADAALESEAAQRAAAKISSTPNAPLKA
jgi:multisubunit Na+/H+ antiporter MnhE subunit